MSNTALLALSPLDGRYADKVTELRPLFSESGLNHQRITVEIRWLQYLANVVQIAELPLTTEASKLLQDIIKKFNDNDATRIKAIEKTTNHDVKAVEYFIKEQIASQPELVKISEFIHFACTSEDINNLSYAMSLSSARKDILLPTLAKLTIKLQSLAHEHAHIPLLARTHGQAATPTTVGKEFANILARLQTQIQSFVVLPIYGKINGAVGNYNAHSIAYPELNWPKLCQQFVESLGLSFNDYTTQIEPHDYIASLFHNLVRINTVLIDSARDIWGYISLDYFAQKTVQGEIGSSTMPHKVNPIDFENAEGNLSLANAILDFLAGRLPISRWQRDLVDSTLLRNLGLALGHCLVGYKSLLKGLDKLIINDAAIRADLDKHWEVLTEAIQTVMRRYGIENPYEKLKDFSRGKQLDQSAIQDFIKSLALPDEVKQRLLSLTPSSYVGYAAELATKI